MVFQTKQYKWAAMQFKVPAQDVGETLERIESRDGVVTSKAFLDESRPVDSATHALFEWNDQKAAEKYRLVQSGKIIRNLEVVVQVDETSEPTRVNAMVSVTPGRLEKASYINVETALTRRDTREIVLHHATEELKIFRKKYKDLTELAGVFSEIEKLTMQKGA